MVIYLPSRNEIDYLELALMFFDQALCKHGVPDHIVTDRGKSSQVDFGTESAFT
jgi:hypothetical protein